MKYIFVVLIFIFKTCVLKSQFPNSHVHRIEVIQKPPIDTNALRNWQKIGTCALSNNGYYAFYTIEETMPRKNTLIVQATNGSWRKDYKNVSNVAFSNDNLCLFFMSNHRLCILWLGGDTELWTTGVNNLKIPQKSSAGIFAYLTDEKKLVLRTTDSSKQKEFESVEDYMFSDNGKILAIKQRTSDSLTKVKLVLYDIMKGYETLVWKGKDCTNIIVDQNGAKIAFIEPVLDQNHSKNKLWCFDTEKSTLGLIINGNCRGIDSNFVLDNRKIQFSISGNQVIFSLKNEDFKLTKITSSTVNVWSYLDTKLQSLQLHSLNRTTNFLFTAVVNLDTKMVIKLESNNEQISQIGTLYNDRYALIEYRKGDPEEAFWNSEARASIYLVSTIDGSKKNILRNIKTEFPYYKLSVYGNFVIYYNDSAKNYFSYEVETGKLRNITETIKTSWVKGDFDMPRLAPPIGIAGWMEFDRAVLLYSQKGVWLVDPLNIKKPINLTKDLSENNEIDLYSVMPRDLPIKENSRIIFQAFDRNKKKNGFYSLKLKSLELEKLTMGDYLYNWINVDVFDPIKARDADVYLVRRMSCETSPNYFLTTDFKTYHQLSDVRPELAYNWIRSELVFWQSSGKITNKGILYKPENFDPNKKYPVIIYMYERLSDNLNRYLYPKVTGAAMNIPYYVSNGYLVFEPDIYYKTGHPGQSVFKTVISAVNHLSKYSWFDTSRLGLQGHSYGAYEVLYILTRTNLFKAAEAGSGISDFISHYGAVILEGVSTQKQYEVHQMRIGVPLWRGLKLYIENSPIFGVNRVKTPLLMMANPGDVNIPYSQSIEFFLALRRLGKKTWMLQYDNEQHVLVFEKDAWDFTTRMYQFFNHYLKGNPAPKWMTKGISADFKGIENGLDLDMTKQNP